MRQKSHGRNKTTDENDKQQLRKDLQQNQVYIMNMLGHSSDVVMREIQMDWHDSVRLAICYIDGLVNQESLERLVDSLLHATGGRDSRHQKTPSDHSVEDFETQIKDFVIPLGNVEEVDHYDAVFESLLSGKTILLLDQHQRAITVDTKGWEMRGVQESSVQSVVRGPRDSFSEDLSTNTSLVRRRIHDPRLWIESRTIGAVTKTKVAIMYIHGIANDKEVNEVRQRLDKIKVDRILESGNIEELIQDEVFSPFPTLLNTERPDTVAGNLLEGRIAIFVDGTPVVLIAPVVFIQFFQSSEDYYQRSDFGLLRLLRFISFFVTLLAPSIYIAVTTFHQEMLPTTLMISIAEQRERIPFPAAVEAFLMELTFEILREAGIRMPRTVGPAISIVGALVLGEAAVQAGLVSPAMVIIVSITAITSFVLPYFSMSIPIRMLRFLFMIVAASFGLYGVFIGLMVLTIHLCSIRSFGIPYMSPLSPLILPDQKDVLFRAPMWAMHSRPRLLNQNNVVRERSASPQPDSESKDDQT